MQFIQRYIKIVSITITLALVLAISVPAKASDWECASQTPAVEVKTVTTDVQFNRTKSRSDLTHMKGSEIEEGDREQYVNGLGGGTIGLEGRAFFQIVERGHEACIALQKIEAIFYAHPDIHIASNYHKNTCEYNAILEHEMKHVNTLTEFHSEYTGIFKTELRLIAGRIKPKGPVPKSHAKNIQEQMNKRITRHIKSFNKRILPLLERKQSAIDTPEEYSRVTAQCRNWN